MPSIGERLEAANWRPSGFDYLRLGLAVIIALQHAESIAEGDRLDLWRTPAQPVLLALLPMFFALSGFLVTGSLLRSQTIGKFLGLRIIRIFPALTVEVLLSAIIIGPIVTTYTPPKYFSDPEFYVYFLNVVGDIHFYLPGVFKGNHYSYVNQQLWTIPFELYCYLAIAAIALIGARRWRVIAPLSTAVFMLGYLLLHGLRHDWSFGFTDLYSVPGIFLVFSFLIGVCFYLYKEKIPWSTPLFVTCVLLAIACALTKQYSYAIWTYAYPLITCYITVYLGATNIKKIFLIKTADYSYGIYLYHYVIFQALYQILPITHHWYWMMLFSFPLVVAFSAMSWHLVEKPALDLRKKLDELETFFLSLLNRRVKSKS